MAPGTVNANLTLIPDGAEVWLILKSAVADSAAAAALIPSSVGADLTALGWGFTGLVDDKKGIPLDPTLEITEYDAFGHPKFRVKGRKGKLITGFTALETNTVTKQVVLPGSSATKIGAPKDVQIYVLYKFTDETRTTIWVALTPALAELKSHGGILDGELSWAEIAVHHTTDSNNDIFTIVTDSTDDVTKTYTLSSGVTAYTTTAGANTTSSISTLTATALQTALRGLASVSALPSPGVTVTGTGGAPGTLTAVFTAAITPVTASGTGGTVTVA